MLVNGIDMIHVMLHLGDDTTEIRHKAPENAGLAQAAKSRFRVFFRCQHLDKQPVRFRIVADRVDDMQIAVIARSALGGYPALPPGRCEKL